MKGITNDYGWIRLHRRSLTSSVFSDEKVWMVWCWCLMKACHQTQKFPFNGQDLILQPGEFVTGRNAALSELNPKERKDGMTAQKLRTAIKYLKSTSRITIRATNKFSIFTILNWEKYQSKNYVLTSRAINEQPTTNQQLTTYKNDKKEKNNIAETSSALKVNNKSMKTYNENNHSDDGLPVIDGDTREILTSKVQTKKYPNAKAIFALFGKHPANWRINKTQLQAAENLFVERGIEQVIKALNFIKENKDDKFCPIVNSPYDLDSKWAKIIGFKKRQ